MNSERDNPFRSPRDGGVIADSTTPQHFYMRVLGWFKLFLYVLVGYSLLSLIFWQPNYSPVMVKLVLPVAFLLVCVVHILEGGKRRSRNSEK